MRDEQKQTPRDVCGEAIRMHESVIYGGLQLPWGFCYIFSFFFFYMNGFSYFIILFYFIYFILFFPFIRPFHFILKTI